MEEGVWLLLGEDFGVGKWYFREPQGEEIQGSRGGGGGVLEAENRPLTSGGS